MKVGQSKKHSLLESIINVCVGFMVGVGAQYMIFPIFGIYVPFMEHVGIAGFFTLVSLARSYCLRRIFNWIHLK
jgi:hypothetical protein